MIEFDDLEAADDGFDEDLPQPPERRRRGSPRARRLLAVAATVLAAGGLVTYAHLSGPGARPQAAPSSTSTSASAPAPPSPTSADGGLLVEHLGDRNGTLRNDVEVSIPARLVPPACPPASDGFDACTVGTTVSTAFRTAVHSRYPQAENQAVSTAVLRASDPLTQPGLWTRLFHARLSGGTLTILVTRNEARDAVMPTSIGLDNRTVVYVRHVDPKFCVEVQLNLPGSRRPSLGTLAALAADVRLTAF